MMAVLETIGLTKIFRTRTRGTVTAVDDLSLQVQEGEIFGLVGPNGSGKTTTLKLLLGLLYPTEGQALLFGQEAMRSSRVRDRIGFLPEIPSFYDYLNAYELLNFYAAISGLSDGAARRKRVDDLLEMVGMSRWRETPMGQYSKGMVQRVGFAQALIGDPDLALLDEPTSGLDPLGSRDIREMILGLKAAGKTVFLCSHLLDEVQRICDRVAIVHEGRLLQMVDVSTLEGRLEDVFMRSVGGEQ